jgi:DNA repair protein RadB
MADVLLSTGSPDLDGLLGGGIEPRVITQFFGEPAGGKSTICVMTAVSCLRGGRGVIFIDTEGFSIERFRQVAGEDAVGLSERLILFEPHDFDEQGVVIGQLDPHLRAGDIGLIVLDSATGFYRTRLAKGKDAMQKLTAQMVQLLGYAKRYNIPVVITNQVYMDTVKNVYMGLGGTALEHISKVIVRIDRTNSHRKATLVKHRSLPAGGMFRFDIVNEGIRALNQPASG